MFRNGLGEVSLFGGPGRQIPRRTFRPTVEALEERLLLSPTTGGTSSRHRGKTSAPSLPGKSGKSKSTVTEVVVHPFGGVVPNGGGQLQPDGVQPEGNVTLNGNGTVLYGRTFSGGTGSGPFSFPTTFDGGVIYRVNADGTGYTVLHNFTGSDGLLTPPDGLNPRHNAMTLSADGTTLYGMTVAGGTTATATNPGLGVIFRYDITTGAFTVLHSFTGATDDGAVSHGSVSLSADGTTLYGMTEKGGLFKKGVLFSMSIDGTGFKPLFSFGGDNHQKKSEKYGTEPHGTPTLVGHHLYGMTRKGGENSQGATLNNGVLFDFDLSTGQMTLLHAFGGSAAGDGATPFHGEVLFADNVLYGMTTEGGDVNKSTGKPQGIIFSYDLTTKTYTVLHPFTGKKDDGGRPEGSLVLVNGELYGVTSVGGTHDQGTLFQISPTKNNLKVRYSFHGDHGDHPIDSAAPVVVGNTITFYGMTQKGGSAGGGVIFAVQLTGT
jgi:uncharacterized repeat protein (TIGR03803 family)